MPSTATNLLNADPERLRRAKSAIVSGMETAAPLTGSAAQIGEDELAPLLDAIGNQDRQAFEIFYDATSQRVLGLALRVTQRRELAEEVVCDVYVQVWENPDRYEVSRGTVIAWLMTLSRSRAIDALRREKTRTVSKEKVEALRVNSNTEDNDPQDLLQAVDRESSVYGALNELNAEQRQLIALAFFRGYSHTEIAEFTATPLGTVKTQIRRALVALRVALNANPGTGEGHA